MGWDRPPTEFIDELEKNVNEVVNKAVNNTINNVQALSPVDTGRYRNSHHISVGSPSYAMSGATTATLAIGQYEPVFIQTNVPYCIRLENGWSKQAPTGVYGNAFNSMVASLG